MRIANVTRIFVVLAVATLMAGAAAGLTAGKGKQATPQVIIVPNPACAPGPAGPQRPGGDRWEQRSDEADRQDLYSEDSVSVAHDARE
jgi:hypothetical protein